MKTETNNSRVIYFDILNVLACFAVLALHHNGIVHNYNVHELAWKQALFFEVAFYWAVPIFFMLSGATLLGYREKYSTKDFFAKRVSKAVIPFLLWSFILVFHDWLFGDFKYNNIQEIFSAILNTKVRHGDIYWFFIPLISLYCFIPVISLVKDNNGILWYMAIFIFITHSCFPLLFKFLGIKYNFSLSFPVAGYILFLILGYIFSRLKLTRFQRGVIYFLGVSSALFRYFLTLNHSVFAGKVDKFLFGYMHFHSVLLALAVFVFIKYTFSPIVNREAQESKIFRFLRHISSCSLGIYLIHKLIMSYELKILDITPDNVYWRFFGMILTYVVCLILVLVSKKVRFLKHLFP